MYTLNYGGEKMTDKQEAVRMNMSDIEKAIPFVTLEEIKTVLKCQDDKAREVMENPDLEKFPVGRSWRVRRDLWYEFIYNVYTMGLPDPKRGFKFGVSFEMPELKPGKNYEFLSELGFTDEQITEAYNYVQEERRKTEQCKTEDNN